MLKELQLINPKLVIACYDNIININHQREKRLPAKLMRERVIYTGEAQIPSQQH